MILARRSVKDFGLYVMYNVMYVEDGSKADLPSQRSR
jgi:hypothetical protein